MGGRITSDSVAAFIRNTQEHWRRIRTNNGLERIMKEIRRRTRVVGAFPDGHSALMLCAARLRHVAGTKWSSKRYLSMDLLKDIELEREQEQELFEEAVYLNKDTARKKAKNT